MAIVHPLEPLTADEIRTAVSVVRASGRLGDAVLFVRVFLHEPPKSAVLAFHKGDSLERRAFVLLRDRRARTTCEVVVSITTREIVSWKEIPGVQPPITFDEFLECERMVRANPVWQRAMDKRGVKDFSLAMVDPWSAGNFGIEEEKGRRLSRTLITPRRHRMNRLYPESQYPHQLTRVRHLRCQLHLTTM